MRKRLSGLPTNSSMDIDLHGIDAFDATSHIKAHVPEIKVIMVSVINGETYRKAAAKRGGDAFLPKSAEISELLSAIGWGDWPCAIACKEEAVHELR